MEAAYATQLHYIVKVPAHQHVGAGHRSGCNMQRVDSGCAADNLRSKVRLSERVVDVGEEAADVLLAHELSGALQDVDRLGPTTLTEPAHTEVAARSGEVR